MEARAPPWCAAPIRRACHCPALRRAKSCRRRDGQSAGAVSNVTNPDRIRIRGPCRCCHGLLTAGPAGRTRLAGSSGPTTRRCCGTRPVRGRGGIDRRWWPTRGTGGSSPRDRSGPTDQAGEDHFGTGPTAQPDWFEANLVGRSWARSSLQPVGLTEQRQQLLHLFYRADLCMDVFAGEQ